MLEEVSFTGVSFTDVGGGEPKERLEQSALVESLWLRGRINYRRVREK